MSKHTSAGTAAVKTVNITAVIVKNTTSPEEKSNGSLHYTLVCNIREILNINVFENLRVGYTTEESSKRPTPVHKEVSNSFLDDPSRFIQRHSGFTVVCDDIKVSNPQDYGINKVTLTNASLINGAQTQDLLRKALEDLDANQIDNNEFKDTNIRVEVMVEQDAQERDMIAIARNTAIKVHDISKLGKRGYFSNLRSSMVNALGQDFDLQESETDDKLPTLTLLQVLRAMTPRKLRAKLKNSLKDSPVRAYSGKASVLKEFIQMKDDENKGKLKNKTFRSEIVNFYESFAPIAWLEYEKWKQDQDWVPYWTKANENRNKIGKFDTKTKEFELGWALLCPLLYSLQEFIHEEKGEWILKYPKTFNKEKFMSFILNEFKKCDFVPQEFAKDKSNYNELLLHIKEEHI